MTTTFLLLLQLCIFSAATAEYEDLSTPELEQILKELDYDEAAYRATYDYDPTSADYYPTYEADVGDYPTVLMPRSAADEMAQIRQIKQEESLKHGIPAPEALDPSAPRVTGGGTTKANIPPSKSAGNGGSAVLPAYCDPPNPCPIGYTEKDGCIESFENTSEFSREYQGHQNCLCDSEHMFDCPTTGSRGAQQQKESDVEQGGFLAGLPPSLESGLDSANPFLSGTKLPIAAKKGLGF